jgi:hypothetical protein
MKQNYGTKEYPSFWKTITESKEWKAWMKEMMERFRRSHTKGTDEELFDVDESHECGWMSPRHWKAFIKFIKKTK